MLPKTFKPKKNYKLQRMGGKYDGGYLVDINSIKISNFLISGGIFYDYKFENDYLDFSNKKKIYCFDHTINPYIHILRWTLILFKRLLFLEKSPRIKKSIKNIIKTIRFLKFIKKERVFFYKIGIGNNSKNIYSINKILCKIQNKNFFFLKIDIEGDEYKILEQIISNEHNISGLVIEFHNVEKNIRLIEDFIKKLRLKLIYTHINNVSKISREGIPSIVEMSFSQFAEVDNNLDFKKHKFDYPNNPNIKDIEINFRK